jgi:DNA-binding CsgD family transcriptional regulator
MLAAVRDRTGEEGFCVLQARCHELESGFPHGVVRQLFESWLMAAGPEERGRVLRGPARPAWPLLDHAPQTPLTLDGSEGQQAFLNGLYWMCVHIAERRPLALLVDDIRWADSASLRFLHYLSARLDDQPVLLAFTTDTAEQDPQTGITQAVVSSPAARLVRLNALSETGVRAYLDQRLGKGQSPRLAHACYRATGGIPFVLHEVLNDIATITQEEGEFHPERVFDLAPPKVVRRVLRRLALLPPAAVALVQAMAVLGDEADLKLAIDVAGIDQSRVAEALGALADTGLLHPGVPPRFVFTTIRAAIYQNLPVSTRNAAHAHAARLLAAAAAPLDDIAGHLVRADVAAAPTVVALLRKAAGKAVAENRPATAVTYLTRALQEPPAVEDRVALLSDLGRAELRCSRVPMALEHLSQAMELSEDVTERGWVGLDLATGLVAAGRTEDAVTMLEVLRKELDDRDDKLGTLMDIALVGAAQKFTHLRPKAVERLRRLAEDGGSCPEARRMLAAHRALAALQRGAPASEVSALVDETLTGLQSDDVVIHTHDVSALLWTDIAALLVCCDRLVDADRLLSHTLDDAQRNGLLLATDIYHSLRAWVRRQSGRLADAETDARKALERISAFGFGNPAAAFPVAALSDVLTLRHEFGAAKAVLDEYDFKTSVQRTVMYAPVLFARARLKAASGDSEAGAEDIIRACQLADDSEMSHPALVFAGEAVVMLARAGHTQEARDRADALLPRARAFGSARTLAAALRASALAEGGDGATHIGRLAQAVDLLSGSESRIEHATALVDLGGALRRADRLEQARRTLSDGLMAAQNCGAWGLVKNARSELSAMGVRVRVPEAGVGTLSPQERRVADLAADGKRNRDIAQTLFVTVKTVEWHLNRVYRKLGIASRDELRKALTEEYA